MPPHSTPSVRGTGDIQAQKDMAIPRTLVIVLWSSIVEDSILVGAEETENGLRIASDGGLRTRGAISNRRRSLGEILEKRTVRFASWTRSLARRGRSFSQASCIS